MNLEQTLQLAISHHQSGCLAEAERLYRQILSTDPNHPDALHLLGLIAQHARHDETAVQLIGRAITLRPNWPEAIYNLGLAYAQMGRVDDAIAAYQRALSLRPRFPRAWNSLGNALQSKGEIDEAIAAYRQAIDVDPEYADAHNNLGTALRSKRDLPAAIAACQRALALRPGYAEAFNNLGVAQQEAGEIDLAIASYRRAIDLKPDYAEARANLALGFGALANSLMVKRQLDDSIKACESAIALDPDNAALYNNLGSVLFEVGRSEDALAAFDRAVDLEPGNASFASARISALHYHPAFDPAAVAAAHFRWGRQFAQSPDAGGDRSPKDLATGRRLRIGYVSPDFRAHPVGRFLLPLLEHHDRAQFEVFCYSNAGVRDAITLRIERSTDRWRDIAGQNDQSVARQIRDDAIDILVDLAGHTRGNRAQLFAAKPAPIAISYLGYPSTSGIAAIDYRLTDNLADPPEMTEHLYVEKLIRLPVNWCYTEPDDSPDVPPADRDQVRFCSFNHLAKVTDVMLQVWARILRDVPRSQLVFKSSAFTAVSPRERLQRRLEEVGIKPSRMEILQPVATHTDHLATLGQMDIALDTFPYHGTATTCDALWMGLPAVTLAGQSHVSRVGVSLLSNVGLPELIATTADDYVQIAVELAGNRNRLAALRQSLRDRMRQSPLMDAKNFAREVEATYQWITRRPDRD